ncbi:S1C family serine protease [Streptomyces sp. NPDC057702]|uniref:S1C family serine protease n=1 Tax=unclassified Streptomyces TaxID=2593676 RepID=UPI0036B8646A
MSVSRVRGLARRLRRVAPAVACAVALLAGCSSDAGSGPGPDTASGADSARATRTPDKATPRVGGEGPEVQRAYEETVRAVLPSVVQITTDGGLGSGVVYDGRGHIVTNAHVVGDARSFDVTLATGSATLPARLVASFPPQDLAVIQLERPPKDLKPATFGDSGEVRIGQLVLAMGSPLGLSGSVTQGIVSAVDRTVGEGRGGGGTGATIGNLVQTSAAINPGNSGGALVTLDHRVVGIPTLAAADPARGDQAAGIGFAIPAATATRIADQMIRHGRVTQSGKAALGITGRTVLGPDYQPAGIAIVEVTRGGAAAGAGLRAGDRIVSVADTTTDTMAALSDVLARHVPGDRVTLAYDRQGTRRTATVTLGEL